MRILRGKWALITGAASGIGHAIAMALASEGMKVWLVDQDAAGLEAIRALIESQGAETKTSVTDLACEEQLQALIAEVLREEQRVDLVVNNAGVLHYGPSEQMPKENLDRLIAVNLLAPLELTRALLPPLLCRPESHLVNISSLYGYFVTPRSAAYHASKFGLLGFSESLAVEYAGTSFHVTTVCPGYVWTSLFASSTSGRADGRVRYPPRWICVTPEHVARQTVKAILRNRRIVVIGAVAKLVYFLQRLAPWLPWSLQRLKRWKGFRLD